MWIVRCLFVVLWILWFWPYVFRAPHGQKRAHITVAGPTRIGLLLETAAIWLVIALPVAEPPPAWRIAAALVLAAAAILMSWSAVKHLGRQFRIHAGLYEDHELVRSGPYAVVRHPIYCSLMMMLLVTILLLGQWLIAAISVAMYLAGTEIRVRVEDHLLASRFGKDFEEYRRAVPAYIPFVR